MTGTKTTLSQKKMLAMLVFTSQALSISRSQLDLGRTNTDCLFIYILHIQESESMEISKIRTYIHNNYSYCFEILACVFYYLPFLGAYKVLCQNHILCKILLQI